MKNFTELECKDARSLPVGINGEIFCFERSRGARKERTHFRVGRFQSTLFLLQDFDSAGKAGFGINEWVLKFMLNNCNDLLSGTLFWL